MTEGPLLICPQCCSQDIEGAVCPEDEDLMRCRRCGHQLSYRDMREEIGDALARAIRLIHLRVAYKYNMGQARGPR